MQRTIDASRQDGRYWTKSSSLKTRDGEVGPTGLNPAKSSQSLSDGERMTFRIRQELMRKCCFHTWRVAVSSRCRGDPTSSSPVPSRMGRKPLHGDDSGGLFGQITPVKEAIQHTQRHVLNTLEAALVHDGALLPEQRPHCSVMMRQDEGLCCRTGRTAASFTLIRGNL